MEEKKYVFIPGTENTEFWELLDILNKKAESKGGEWKGDFLVSRFELDGKTYIYWEDMEYGIPYEIIETTTNN